MTVSTRSSARRRLAAVAGLVVVSAVCIVGMYRFLASRYNGGNDFFSRYVAWRALIFEGRNPYSDAVTQSIQMAMNGRLALPGEDENGLIYPLYAVVVQWPFVLLPWPWARSVLGTVSLLFVVAGLVITVKLLNWSPSLPLLAATAAWAVLFYPEARGLILGQIVVTQYMLAVLALWLLRKKRDTLAGVCLALTTVRPTAVLLLVPFLLVYSLHRRRPRLVVATLSTLLLLCLASFLVLPSWFSDWLYRIVRYWSYATGYPPVWLLVHKGLGLSAPWEWLLTFACLVGMGWFWWRACRTAGDEAFHWAMGMTLVVSDLVMLRSATTNYIFLLFPTYLIFAALDRLWPHAGRWAIVGYQVLSLVGMWWLFAATVQGNAESPVMFIPEVVLIGLALLLGTRPLMADNRRAGVVM